MCSPMTFGCLLFGVICVVSIDGLTRKRLFKATDVGALYYKNADIIDEIYATSAFNCAFQCIQTDSCVDFLYRKPGSQPDYDHCYTSPTVYGYTGHLGKTINGWNCQRWDTNYPNTQVYGASNFIDGTLQEAGNYCRDPTGHGYAWCYLTITDPFWDNCNVVKCMATGTNCRLYSTASSPHGPWTGYSYYQGSE